MFDYYDTLITPEEVADPQISESDRASAIPGERWMCRCRLPARYGQSGTRP